MANKSLAAYAKEKHEEARRNLGLAAIDFSIPDEKILEIREALRQEAQQLKKKRLARLLGALRASWGGVAGFFRFRRPWHCQTAALPYLLRWVTFPRECPYRAR